MPQWESISRIKGIRYCSILGFLFLFCCKSSFGQDKTVSSSVNPVIDSLLLILKNTHEDTIKVKALNQLARLQYSSFMTDGATSDNAVLKTANEALILAKKLNNKYEQGVAIQFMGFIFRQKGKLTEAIEKFKTVLKLSEEINDMLCAGNQHYNIGNIYSMQGNISKAIEHYLMAIKIWLETDDKRYIVRGYDGLAGLYLINNFNEKAIKYYQLALEEAEKTNDKILIAQRKQFLGIANKNIGHYPEAKKYFLDALETLEQPGQNPADCYIGMGWAYFLEAAFGKTTTIKQNYSEALTYFQKALKIGKETRIRWFVEEAYIGIAEIYKKQNDFEKALEYTTLRYQLKDSIFTRDATNRIERLKTQYEMEKLQIEAQARQQVFQVRDEALKEKILNEQKLKQERILAEEELLHEKEISEQKYKLELEKQKALSEEKASSEKKLATEKVEQEKIRAEKQQTNNLLLMGLILVIATSVFLFLYLRQSNQKKRAVEKAEAIHKMAELEMQSLRSQLNPHFMFNSLNSIQELILLEENDKSHIYLSRFSKLLRMLLENAEKPFIPLQRELDFLQLYLDLENLRVPDLQYSISTDTTLNPSQTLIPNMILQPFIENAIWHGLSNKTNDKQLRIRIFRENGTVNYEIEDNGVGRKKSMELKSVFKKNHISKGMELLSKRFNLLNKEYSTNINIAITDVLKNNDVSGTLVSIKIPATFPEYFQN